MNAVVALVFILALVWLVIVLAAHLPLWLLVLCLLVLLVLLF